MERSYLTDPSGKPLTPTRIMPPFSALIVLGILLLSWVSYPAQTGRGGRSQERCIDT